MDHDHSFADGLIYTRALVHAGVTGLRKAHLGLDHPAPEFAHAARNALTAAAFGAGAGWLACRVGHTRKRKIQTAFVVAGIAFCADFCWLSRVASRRVLVAVRKEVSSARDQHWLDLNPVDYA